MKKRQKIGFGVSLMILAIIWFIPTPEGMTAAGLNTLGLLLMALILWVTEAIPLAVTAIALVALQPVFGIAEPAEAFSKFMNSVFFFVIASYGISIAIMHTTFINRLANWLLRKTGGNSFNVILALTASVAFLSALISNVPACAVFMGFALGMLEPLEEGPAKTGLRKTLMIAIPFGAMIGGIATPAGSSVNILALTLLEEKTGIVISFLQWMVYGVPIVLISVPFCAFILVKIFRPAEIGADSIAIILKETTVQQPLNSKEKKLLIILGLMIIFWLAGTWVPEFNITIVALVGLIIMFLPGINVLEWDEFVKEVSWDAVIMIGGVSSIGAAVSATGLTTLLMSGLTPHLTGMDMIPLVALVGMFFNVIHILLPIAPAIVAVGVEPLVNLANAMSISPVLFIITLSFMAGICLLLPLDAVPLLTYTKKYYTMWDMFKAGIIVSTVIVLLLAIWGTFVSNFIGF